MTSGEQCRVFVTSENWALIGQFAVLLSPSLSKVCHPPCWIKLDWNHHQSKNKELNCTQSSRQRPTCTWVAFYSSGNININLLSLSLLIVAFLRPIRDTHCVSQSRTRGGMKTWNITSVWRRAGDLESESDDLISIFHEMSSRPGGRMSSYGTS